MTLALYERAERNAEAARRHDKDVNAWVVSDYARALDDARRMADDGASVGALEGKLIGIKDIIDVAGYPTRCGSAIYEDAPIAEDAACVSLIRKAGGIIAGKTTTTEFAYFAPTRTANPHDHGCTPGGSSSGSAAAVATGMVEIALGTQTAASITRPASFCGIFGFKPTFGTYSLAGVKTLAHSLDTLGTLARSVADIAAMHEVLGRLPHAPLMARKPKIGLCRTPAWSFASADSVAALSRARALLEAAGAAVVDVLLPLEYDSLAEMQVEIMAYDAARDLAYEDLHFRDRLSPQIKALIDRGLGISRAAYAAAQARAAAARAMSHAVFDDCDIVLAPAAPGEAPIGLQTTGDPVFSRMWTLLQLPTICVPGFEGARRMPIGVQFLAPLHEDERLLGHAAWVAEVFAELKPGRQLL